MKMKRILSAALVLAMLVGLVPGAGMTAEATGETDTKEITQTNTTATMAVSLTVGAKEAVAYQTWDEDDKALVPAAEPVTDYKNVRADVKDWTAGWYVVDKGVEIAERITVTGDVHLILCDGATLTASKGITFADNEYSLTVYGQTKGTGALVATGGSGQAGIGGGDLYDDVGSVGTVTINGGFVTATGGAEGAGIGGGKETAGKIVTINGGTVTATGSYKGAGIGGGSYASGGTVNINGGTVTAKADGEDHGTAIGAGYSESGCTINVSEGMIAVAGDSAANAAPKSTNEINGCKWVYLEKNAPLTDVTYLDAAGESQTLNAGTPEEPGYTRVRPYTPTTWSNGCYVVDKDVTITDRVTVSGEVNLVLMDGATLTASKGITVAENNSLTIYGQEKGTGALIARTDERIASIGGDSDNCGTVTINGGVIEASGAYKGIAAKQVTVNNGTVTATAVNYPLSVYGTLSVNGGAVTSTGYTGLYLSSNTNVNLNGGTVTLSGSTKAIASLSYCEVTLNNGVQIKAGESEPGDTVELDYLKQHTSDFKWVKFAIFHRHNFTSYALSTTNAAKDTITAECDNADEKCPLPLDESNKHTATLTIVPKDDGTATLTGGADFGKTDADIVYYQQQNNEWTLIENNGKPSGDGFFKASITVGPEGSTKTAEVIYGVGKITKDANFNATDAHGDFEVPKAATIGATVTPTVTPDAGYELDKITATKSGGEAVSPATDTGFTMPAESVTVSASFKPRDVGVTLTATAGTPCAAALLNGDFSPVGEGFSRKTGETFFLCVNGDADYDYTIKLNDKVELANENVTECTAEQYAAYAQYLKNNKLTAPEQTDVFQITMPAFAEGDLSVKVEFEKLKTFTILYQTESNPAYAWCKFTNGSNETFVAVMKRNAAVDGAGVWSVTAKSKFVPTSVAFITANSALSTDDLKAAIGAATNMSSVNSTTSREFTSVGSGSGSFCVIGGGAKAVVAAFANGGQKTYEIGVCGIDGDGNVTTPGTVKAPSASEKTGFTFKGWRGFQYDQNKMAFEKVYAAGENVTVYENTTLTAVWEPVVPSVTLNRNGGTGGSEVTSATYGKPLNIEVNPTKNGFVFEDWTVGASVTEGDTFFPKGSVFDFAKSITSDLTLNAQWKHVHSYVCFQLKTFPSLKAYADKYANRLHVKICGCGDVALEAHSLNSLGRCACGFENPTPSEFELNVSYQRWEGGACKQTVNEFPETVQRNQEVSVYAPDIYGSYKFNRWEYSTDGTKWYRLATDPMISFIIPCKMTLRAIYEDPTSDPEIMLSTSKYTNARVEGINGPVPSILFHMDYKLPVGYTLVDAGVRLGDNNGISYYEMKEVTQTTGQKAIMAGASLLTGGLTGFLTDQTKDALAGPDYYYAKREDNVLNTMSAKTLSEYMYQFKPVNVEDYPPIYWESKVTTKSRSGSLNVLTPAAFALRNENKHYIYGMAYLSYKDDKEEVQTIYTDAIAITLADVLEDANQTKTARPAK